MIYNIAGNFEAENSLNLTLMAVVGQHSTFNCQLSTVNIVQLYNNIITNPLHLYNTIFTLLHTQMIFCVLGRLGRGKIKHLGDDMEGKVKEGGMLCLHSVLIFHPYALEVLCLKVRTSLQVLGFTCTIYYPSFKSKIQSLDPLGSKSRKTR